MTSPDVSWDALIEELIQQAGELGASGARAIAAAQIVVKDELAELCRPPGCANYGLAPSCPPHVAGPAGFRKLKKQMQRALVVKIDVPQEIMLSSQIREVMALLQEVVAQLEQAAIQRGYTHSRAFAGGSCKKIFCGDQAQCVVLSDNAPCRHGERARPSMSGYGIDVAHLMEAAGWEMRVASQKRESAEGATHPLCGLVLIG